MIPKKIHYVWVGNQPKPELVLKCIDSWKKHLPDYEIIEWNNERFEEIKNTYSEQAYQNKKWAFVSDYIRLYALYHEGGIYLDTDVEITKNMDEFLQLDFFSCYEKGDEYYPITSAVMGAKKKNAIIGDLLSQYNDLYFETINGLDLETNIIKITSYFKSEFNLLPPYDGTKKTYLNDNSIIYPSNYFCTPELGMINFAIHHFNGSWLPSHSRKDKLKFYKNKLIFSRFIRLRDTGEPQVSSKEKVLFKIPVSKNKQYVLIMKR
ncbi:MULTISPECIES: glycosyltransferase family 32 protein [unclassified Xenorhabdus]|uniref:glycosyltransferase family 32 protein n=1 Tax=Xenorhabdus TaxID=626 RepID=UPI000C03A73C|nr:glycosyltransferase [Xenorhabdus sp. KJ12.1]PHM70363.1 exopolysaccharide biosynthesis protein, glycosyltransferase [Xenorhabdus sp. KJ12.1]